MILFPGSKINIGLNVLGKRTDGYHTISSVVLPIAFSDILEVRISEKEKSEQKLNIKMTNSQEDIITESNICYKAYCLLDAKYNLDPVDIHLHKLVPSGGGLGGGSADGVATLKALDAIFKLDLTEDAVLNLAMQLGSDCPLFVNPKMVHMSGRGEILNPISLSLTDYFIVIGKPLESVSTARAYESIPKTYKDSSLFQSISKPIHTWKNTVFNDFEEYVFDQVYQAKELKHFFYDKGAIFASMSGSGSAVYGIFEAMPDINHPLLIYKGKI